jgi:translation initiation factor 3 subunit E
MSSPEEFDLTSKNARFMDRHLLIPLVDFLATKKMHTTEELNKSKLEILAKTNMIDSAMEIKGAPAELSKKRDEVVKTMQALEEEVKPILSLVSDAGRVAELKAERCFNQ